MKNPFKYYCDVYGIFPYSLNEENEPIKTILENIRNLPKSYLNHVQIFPSSPKNGGLGLKAEIYSDNMITGNELDQNTTLIRGESLDFNLYRLVNAWSLVGTKDPLENIDLTENLGKCTECNTETTNKQAGEITKKGVTCWNCVLDEADNEEENAPIIQ